MLRLRLGIEDLARTTFAAPTPYCELGVSAQVLQQPTSQFRRLWHLGRARFPAPARRLLELVPAYGSVPAFLAPEACGCLDEALDAVQSTPAALIRAEVGDLQSSSPQTPWIRDLAQGRVDALEELGSVVRIYHDHVMAPRWPTIQRAVAIGWKQPTLVYPLRTWSWAHDPGRDCHDGLAAVLGKTRARVLRALISEHTTTELASALHISPASASTHAAALRGAGMVTTRREGKAVRHALTQLGQAVAAATPGGPGPPLGGSP